MTPKPSRQFHLALIAAKEEALRLAKATQANESTIRGLTQRESLRTGMLEKVQSEHPELAYFITAESAEERTVTVQIPGHDTFFVDLDYNYAGFGNSKPAWEIRGPLCGTKAPPGGGISNVPVYSGGYRYQDKRYDVLIEALVASKSKGPA